MKVSIRNQHVLQLIIAHWSLLMLDKYPTHTLILTEGTKRNIIHVPQKGSELYAIIRWQWVSYAAVYQGLF